MSRLDDELSGVAGEYALGLMMGEQRERFERRLATDQQLRVLVGDWQQRLQPLAEVLAPVTPSPRLWERIEASLEATEVVRATRPTRRPSRRSRWWERPGLWRGWALASTAAAAALAAFLWLQPPAAGTRLIAVLNATGGQPAVLFTADLPTGDFTARAVQNIAAEATDHELWLLPGGDAAPISLGLLAPRGTVRRELPAPIAQQLRAGAAVAVSQEPTGGSPTGQPTGPVVFVGTILAEEG